MEFEIIDANGHAWELYFADNDGAEGTLFFMGQSIGPFANESLAIAHIEWVTQSKVKSSTRVDQ